jgi:purine-binding chemotaxis protein CheW
MSENKIVKLLTFKIDEEVHSLNIEDVIDIIGIQEITYVPNQRGFIKGIINLRGQIIPSMDIRIRFQKEQIPYDDRTCIIVIKYEDYIVGIIVDIVLEVYSIDTSKISLPEDKNGINKFISGIFKGSSGLVTMLDLSKLIFDF